MNNNELLHYEVAGQMSIFDLFDSCKTVGGASSSTDYSLGKLSEKASREFGEHIGGSRKELFASGNFDMAVMDMNDAERDKFIVKDKLWKKPNYDNLIADGVDILAAYAIKKVRDGLPAKPVIRYKHDRKEEQVLYVKFVDTVKHMVEGIRTVDEVLALSEVADSYGVINNERSGRIAKMPGEICGGNLTTALLRALYPTSCTINNYEYEIKKTQFGVSKESKIPTGYMIRKNNDGTFYVTKGYRILSDGHTSYNEALEAAKGASAASKKSSKTRFVPPQLAHIQRTGLKDVRNGRHVSGEDFIKDFKIRGGEFGNWMTEKDAQANLDMCYDAFYDLADVLGCGVDGISVGGKLAIAFGARGHGNAVAHYEPLREVINLTKMRGAGSLAHEMMHAIDDIMGKTMGLNKSLTEAYGNFNLKNKVPTAVQELFKTMLYSPMSDSEKAVVIKRKTDKAEWVFPYTVKNEVADSILSLEEKEHRDGLIKRTMESFKACSDKDTFSKLFDEFIDELTAILKNSKKTRRDEFSLAEHGNLYAAASNLYSTYSSANSQEYMAESEFYKNSKKMDKVMAKEKHGYWSSLCEMFARAGACFVNDELAAKGCRNDYLTGHSESCVAVEYDSDGNKTVIHAMPEGEERKRINEAFRKMLKILFPNE